jgi:dTDP-glucose 4,6-dehydratase
MIQNKSETILVTGGAGFIGSWLVEYLLGKETCSIITLDALTYAGSRDNLRSVMNHPKHQFVHGDIGDEKLVFSLMQQVDACIHVAAQTHVDRSISGPSLFINTNIVGTGVLLEAARKRGLKKFIQVSTDEVYGSISGTALFKETDRLEPSSPYSASKASSDLLALSYWKTFDLPVCITRCTNNYGPRQFPEKLIPLFILNALHNKPLPVYGNGLNVRDWIHVLDHCKALEQVLHQGEPGEIYHIGSGNEWNNLAITRKILALLDKPEDLIQYVADRPGHDKRYALDCQKTQQQLGWHPEISFDEGLRETVQWYVNNPGWMTAVAQP